MNKKKTIILLVIGILVVTTMSIGVTYSYMKPKVEKENNQTEIGINNCANLTLKEKNKTINLTNMYPMEEEMALQKDAYEFTISNTCEEYEGFSLYLTTLNDNGIEDINIRYAITDLSNNVLISDVLSKRPNGISDFSEEELKQLDTEINGTHKNIYKIYGSAISINRNNKYKLYLWIDENAGNETMGKSFTVGLTTKINEEEKKYVKDLSGNNYDGVMQNGALIKLDEEGRQGLYFDGEDDYVDVADLPETINWAGGFTIEFEAKWLAFNYFSRIFDFGKGQNNDNIFVANGTTTNLIGIYFRYGELDSLGTQASINNSIILNKVQKYKIEVINNNNNNTYTFNIYKDNETILSKIVNTTSLVKNIKRVNNYLGKSNWSGDGYFNGYIYNLKITDATGNVILWYDFTNETIEDLSGNGNYGVYHNIASWDDEGITTSDDTKNGYIDCGLVGYDFKNSISLVARIKINEFTDSTHQRFFNNYSGRAGAGIVYGNTKVAYVSIIMDNVTYPEGGTYGYKHLSSSQVLETNTWYTIIGTYDGTIEKIYINGILKGSYKVTAQIPISNVPFWIGDSMLGDNAVETEGADHSMATISDALVFDRALTEEEIARDYANEVNPTNKQDLLLWYKF